MNEQATEYLAPLAELREAVAIRTQVAGVLRQLRLENIQNKAKAEEIAAGQDFEVFLIFNLIPKSNLSVHM
jgi:breast cancer metastasis-suppressor 1-like protein